LVFVFSAITIDIASGEAIWPFDQIFYHNRRPQNNPTNSSSQLPGSLAGPPPY